MKRKEFIKKGILASLAGAVTDKALSVPKKACR